MKVRLSTEQRRRMAVASGIIHRELTIYDIDPPSISVYTLADRIVDELVAANLVKLNDDWEEY